MLDKFRAAIRALQAGEELTHAEVWKDRQNLGNALATLFGALVVFIPPAAAERIGLSDSDVGAVVGAVVVVAGLLNNYLTTATSKRVGLPAGRVDPDDPGA